MNHTQVKTVMFSQWSHELGCLPTRIVMWKQHPELPTSTFATHYETKEDATINKTGKPNFQFTVGHYDMTLEEAKRDFDGRCELLGVKFSHFNADSQVQTHSAEYKLDQATRDKLRPHLLKVWKLNRKIAVIQAERDGILASINKTHGKGVVDQAYAEFEKGVF